MNPGYRKKRDVSSVLLRALAFVIVVSAQPSAQGDSEAIPHCHKTETADGKHEFVMLASSKFECEDFQKYISSGLYRKSETTAPLYTVDWYAHKVYLSANGEYLAHLGPWPRRTGDWSQDLQQLAIAFYHKGQMKSRYTIGEFVKDPEKLQKTISHFIWFSEFKHDQAKDEIRIVTRDGHKYVLDLRTGNPKKK